MMIVITRGRTMNDTATAVRPRPEHVARAFLAPRPPRQRQAPALDGAEALRIATPEGEVVPATCASKTWATGPSSPTRRSSPRRSGSSPPSAERECP